MSVVLLVAAGLIARPLLGERAALFGTALIALSPVLASLGVSVLTEPSYLALVYAGLVPLATGRPPYRWWVPVWVGVFFGLAFIDRIEGIAFLLAIPLITLAWHFLWRRRPSIGATAARVAAFALVFLLVIAPQLLAVRRAEGRTMLNGRQVWSEVMTAPGAASYDQRIYGLDYDSVETNMQYALQHPEVLGEHDTGVHPGQYLRLAFWNTRDLLERHLGELVGTVALVLAGAGVAGLVRERRFRTLVLFGVLLAAMLSVPMLHEFSLRHIVVAAPLLLLLAGRGIDELMVGLFAGRQWRLAPAGGALLTAAVVLTWVPEYRDLTTTGDCNAQYCAPALTRPAALIRAARARGDSSGVAARRTYLAYTAGAPESIVPYAGVDGLRRFLRWHRAGYLLLYGNELSGYPFFPAFAGSQPPGGFRLVYRGQDRMGRPLRLYRFPAGSTAAAPHRGPP